MITPLFISNSEDMKSFLLKAALFMLAILSFFVLICLLPATPRASLSFLFAEIQKDSLLKYEKSPRILFVGGSNVACGLNCQMLKDSLPVHPVNTSITSELGLKYMFDNTAQYVRKGDIVVVAPEYNHFHCEDAAGGSMDLLHMILDVDKSKIRMLNFRQIKNCLPHIGNFAVSRLNPMEYLYPKTDSVYTVDSFNTYGDHCSHWYMPRRYFKPYDTLQLNRQFNYETIRNIKKFEDAIRQKGAVLLLSYPPFQDSSFRNNVKYINRIDKELRKAEFNIIGTPQRYKLPDSLYFDTPYHLIKQGVDKRTALLIEDLRASGMIPEHPLCK
jgi:hypothetical protein